MLSEKYYYKKKQSDESPTSKMPKPLCFTHSCGGGSSNVSSYLPYGRKNALKNTSNSSSAELNNI